MVQNSFLDGNDGAEASMETLRERYGFIGKTLSKVPGFDDPKLIDAAILKYSNMRDASASATYGPDDLPGWRRMILYRKGPEVLYAAVRDDGILFQGSAKAESGHIGSRAAIDVGRAIAEAYAPPSLQDLGDDDPEMPGELSDIPGENEAVEAGKSYFPRSLDEGVPPRGGMIFGKGNWLALSPYSHSLISKAKNAAEADAEKLARFVISARDSALRSQRLRKDDIEPSVAAPENAYAILFRKFEAAMVKGHGRRLGAMAANCMRALDPETSSRLHALALFEPGAANWLTGVLPNGVEVDPVVARNRRQACSAYPILGKYFMRKRGRGLVGEAIDEGRELSRSLSHDLNVPAPVVKRLAGLTWQMAGRAGFEDPRDLVEAMDTIELDHIPQGRKAFADFRASQSAANTVAWSIEGDGRTLLASLGGRFAATAMDLENNPAEGVDDMRKDIERRVLRPALAQRLVAGGTSKEDAMRAVQDSGLGESYFDFGVNTGETHGVLTGHGFRSVLKASERWHRAIGRINDTLGDGSQFSDPRSNSWAPLLGDVALKDGLELVELSSTQDLRMEGLRQNHCVGGYGPTVKSGDAVIFSLRKGDEIISTLEVTRRRKAKGKVDYSVAQNMGRANRDMTKAAKEKDPAGKAAKAAERSLLRSLRALDPARDEAYGRALEVTRSFSAESSLHEDAGYDIFDRKGLELAFSTLREFLPKKQSRMTLDAWLEDVTKAEHKAPSTQRLGRAALEAAQ